MFENLSKQSHRPSCFWFAEQQKKIKFTHCLTVVQSNCLLRNCFNKKCILFSGIPNGWIRRSPNALWFGHENVVLKSKNLNQFSKYYAYFICTQEYLKIHLFNIFVFHMFENLSKLSHCPSCFSLAEQQKLKFTHCLTMQNNFLSQNFF